MTLANLTQFIYQKIQCLISLETRENNAFGLENNAFQTIIYNYYFDYLINAKKIKKQK